MCSLSRSRSLRYLDRYMPRVLGRVLAETSTSAVFCCRFLPPKYRLTGNRMSSSGRAKKRGLEQSKLSFGIPNKAPKAAIGCVGDSQKGVRGTHTECPIQDGAWRVRIDIRSVLSHLEVLESLSRQPDKRSQGAQNSTCWTEVQRYSK